MDGESAAIAQDLRRINVSLTQALCVQQDVNARLSRQLSYATDDLKKSKDHVSALEQMLIQLQQQQQQQHMPALNDFFGHRQQHHGATGNFASTAAAAAALPPPPMAYNEPLFEHRTAGTLLSPGKKGRRPFADSNSNNLPLKMSDLPKKQPASKRPPIHSPPTKPIQKRPSNRPTPEKFKQSAGSGVSKDPVDTIDQQTKKQAEQLPLLSELKSANWHVSDSVPSTAACRPLLSAIFRVSKGNVSLLQVSIDWLVKNVALCRNTLLAANTQMKEAAEVAENIESWLQHNFKYVKNCRTLPLEMNQALQVICSAALFNETNMNADLVRRVLPSVGRKRMKTTKDFNLKLIEEGKPFSWPHRKVRKDAMWPLFCQFVRRKICWNDKYTKVDTNFSRKIKCKEPLIEAMDGGGFRLTGWKVIEREMRMWYEETKLADIQKLIVNSEEWKQLKGEYPSLSMNKQSLRLALCPSVRKPSFRSCVNEKMSALSYLMEDLYQMVNNNDVLRTRIKECPCRRHRAARDTKEMGGTPPLLWHEELRCLPSRFCGMATCPKKERAYLRVGSKEPPRLRDKSCTKSLCSHCGFAKKMGLGDADCKVFKECDQLMEVTLWEKAARNGDRFQREPTRYTGADRKTVAEVYSILVNEVAPVALEHLGEAQWWHAQVDRKIATFDSDELVLMTDFSATPELVAKEVGNCHEAEHCVIDVIVVLDDPRTIQVIKDGATTEKRINSCTYWAFLGPTDGKGKKNDHRFHREALNSIVDFHKKKALERSVDLKTVTMFTDNCGGQFKSQYNMGDIAWFAERHAGVRLEHCYATVFEFKGVHDGFGKTVKWKFKEAELKGHRIPNAKEGYSYLLKQYAGRRSDWDDIEAKKSDKLLQRGPFTMTEVRVGYVADTQGEVDAVLETVGGDHVLHCNRESVPRTVGDKAAEGLTDVYCVRGNREPVCFDNSHKIWGLELSSRVCFCFMCAARDTISEPCPYEDVRDVRQIVVDDKASDMDWCQEQRAKRAVAVYFRKKKSTGYINMNQMKDELRRIGKPFPINAKRMDLAFIFLSMQEDSAATEEEQLLEAIEDEIQNPANPNPDDYDVADTGNTQDELPTSEEEAPTDIDHLLLNDLEDERAGRDYTMSDDELKNMADFTALNDTVLLSLLSKRRIRAADSRAEQEEQLRRAVRPF